ncbi:MAG TPA: hypothetical protein VHM28_02975 [Anaerolineales bacterium]|jgi:hypothetical protein|nr:hypothetical protein [Anaerolineales bacterium]
MDFSPGAATFWICCLTPLIPTVLVSSIYAVISLLPEEKRNAVTASKKLPIFLIIAFIAVFILTGAFLLYWSKDAYAM